MAWLIELLPREINMNFTPMADRLLVRRAEAETKTASGFFIPEVMVEKANRGTVLAIGPGRSLKDGRVIPVEDVKVGDTVMFEGNGINVKVNGEPLVVLKEQEIIAIVD
jgi:chaperonin GroES